MMKENFLLNPFEYVTGRKALAWGVAGIVLSTLLSYAGGLHFHGLLHVGAAPNGAWWCYVVEHLVIWVVPSALLCLLDLIFCRHNVRFRKLFGVVAFAQLPLTLVAAVMLLPAAQEINASVDLSVAQWEKILHTPGNMLQLLVAGIGSLISMGFTLVWMFRVAHTVCRLRGPRLWTVWVLSVFGAEVLVRFLIGSCY